MLIFIDTNIFFNHWYLRSPMFDLLANYVSNERATILVSEVVQQEVVAKFRAEAATIIRDLSKSLRRMQDFRSEPSPDSQISIDATYDFREILQSRFENLIFIPYDKVPHDDLVKRAINATRPFRDGEKGYRDTLIWLSLLQYLKGSPEISKKLAFVNANSNDFLIKTGDELRMHPHLEEDWKAAGVSIEFAPYLSLKEFVDKEIDPVLHSLRHEEFQEELGGELEDLATDTAMEYLQAMPLSQMQEFFEEARVSHRCTRLIHSFAVEDFEGLEDPEIVSLSSLKDGSLVIQYRFNLLTIRYTVEVNTEGYLPNVSEFEEDFMNAEIDGRVTRLDIFRRCYFDASFSYRPDSREFTSASIDHASLKPNSKYLWFAR